MFFQTTTRRYLLIVDDEQPVREGFRWILQDQNEPIEASGVGEALLVIDRERFNSVTPDIRMPEKNGLDGLRLVRERSEDLPVAGVDSNDTAWALRSGALDYLERPRGYDRLRTTSNRIGIPAARLADFMQNDPFNRVNRQSRGLGLFIADWMAHNHGGELQLLSQEGVETTAELFPGTC